MQREEYEQRYIPDGNLAAPPGSSEWAHAIRKQIQSILCEFPKPEDHLRQYITVACGQYRFWQHCNKKDGTLFTSFDEFCTYPFPWGLGESEKSHLTWPWDKLRPFVEGMAAKVRRLKPLARHGGDRRSDQPDNIRLKAEPTEYGTSAEYRIRRLKRDFPGIAEQLAEGAFKSVAAAWRAAGLAKPTDPVEHICRLFAKLTADEQAVCFKKLKELKH